MVYEAFPSREDADEAIKYRDGIRTTIKEMTDAQRRAVFLALALAGAFELIASGTLVHVTLGPFAITDLSPVQKALPAVFAYVIYDLMVLGVRAWYLRRVYLEITKRFQPRAHRSNLDRLLLPHGSSLFGPYWFAGNSRRYDVAMWACTRTLQVGAIVSPFVINVYALYSIYGTFGAKDPIVWISTVAATAFMLYAVLVFIPIVPVVTKRWGRTWPLASWS